MKVGKKFSHKNGEEFIDQNYSKELQQVIDAIEKIDAVKVLSKRSEEKSKPNLCFSPEAMNKVMKEYLHPFGWTKKSTGSKGYSEPRLYWDKDAENFRSIIDDKHEGEREFREMDGILNQVGLEIQFGKYAFMGYDIFSKMPIFSQKGLITCGIEVVVMHTLIPHMSTGVSSFNQIVMDMKARGVADLDIPTLVIGIDCTDDEWKGVEAKRLKYKENPESLLQNGEVSLGRKGAKPGPK